MAFFIPPASFRTHSRWSTPLLTLTILANSANLISAQAASATASEHLSVTDSAALHSALDLYDQRKLQDAEPKLRDLAVRHPGNYESNEALGSLYAESGAYERALPYLKHAARSAPKQSIAHANLGAVLAKLERNQEAIAELETAVRLDPGNASSQSNLGHLFIDSHRPADAAKAFAAAAQADPQNWDYRYNWALTLYSSNQAGKADEVLRGIPAEAYTDQTHSLAGDIAEKQGRFEPAIKEYTAAAQANPSEANLYALTLEFLRHWTWEAALKTGEYAVSRYPDSTRLQVAVGISLYGGSRFPEAATAFSKLLVKDPNNALYADLLGRSCSLLAEGASADCSGLERFALANPQNAQAATYAATNILHQPTGSQNDDMALKLLTQAIAADPRLAEAYYQLGVLQQQKTQWAESIVSLEKAVALKPAYSDAHYRLARAYFHVGKREAGEEQIALQKKYSQQAKDDLNAKLNQVTTFLVKTQ